MKRILTFLLLLSAVSLFAQPVPDTELSRGIRAMHTFAGTNIHSYEFHPVYDSPAPKGYKPFYISHYGRHGSRSSGDGHEYVRLRDILLAAQADGQLTEKGEWLLKATEKVIEEHAGMSGRLTPRGRREHATLAERMYRRYPAVFRSGSKKIFAVSSTVPRCIVSMAAFTNRLMALQKDLDIDVDTGEKYMKYLTRAGNTEIQERAKPILDAYYKRVPVDTTTIRSTIFKDPAASGKYVKNAYKFERDIYKTAQTAEPFDIEDNIFGILPEGVVYKWAADNSMYIYLNHANSAEVGDVRIPRASLLADDIVAKADEVIGGAPRAADLRFGHDWPFVGICCYFGLEGISERMTVEEADGKWVGARYTPLAANLQLIFYRKKGADVLVKFLLNEKETLIPELKAVQGPYYRWDDVKALLATRKKS